MKKQVSGFVILLIAFSINAQVSAQSAGQSSGPKVNTKAGVIQGVTEGDVTIFRGIPFAAPPVGEFRWRPPQPVTPWKGVRDAGKFGPDCAQAGWGAAPGTIAKGSSEDCLYLNIWKPAGAKAKAKLPVMVWIHGGGFVGGSGQTSGDQFARNGVILVTINYRLGRLGFFAFPALSWMANLSVNPTPGKQDLMSSKKPSGLGNVFNRVEFKRENMTFRNLCILTITICSLSFHLNAQNEMSSKNSLTEKQRSIVSIAALTAKGDLQVLKPALNTGLEAGLTVNEIKEVLVHLYAYCGFPRSIRGLQTFMEVLDERNARGITDKTGRDASPILQEPEKYERGKKVLGELTKTAQEKPSSGYGAFAPVIDTFLKEHLFARGNQITSNNFSGTAWLNMMGAADTALHVSYGNVTFAPKARTNWHSHPGGQLLFITEGKGFYQAKGEPARLLKKGDFVEIPRDVVHWHGAAPDSGFAHIAVSLNTGEGGAVWVGPVTNEEYEQSAK